MGHAGAPPPPPPPWKPPPQGDADPGLRNAVLAATTAGSVLLVLGAVRRYVAESQP